MLGARGKNRTGNLMLIPIRCFSCNKVIGGSYEEFVARRDSGEEPAEVMDDLGISNSLSYQKKFFKTVLENDIEKINIKLIYCKCS